MTVSYIKERLGAVRVRSEPWDERHVAIDGRGQGVMRISAKVSGRFG
jgi:hypothetical protein